MVSKKHKRLKKIIKNMENSSHFHLDNEEEALAKKAKRELQLCSFEEFFQEYAQNQMTSTKTKSNLNQSLKTTTTYKDQLISIKPQTKNKVQSRYLLFKNPSPKKQITQKKVHTQFKNKKVSEILISTASLEEINQKNNEKYSFFLNPQSVKSNNQWSNKIFNFTMKKRKLGTKINPRKQKILTCRNNFYSSEKQKADYCKSAHSKSFYSFNDTIENHQTLFPQKVRSSRTTSKKNKSLNPPSPPQNETNYCNLQLRPQILKLINKIKEEKNQRQQNKY